MDYFGTISFYYLSLIIMKDKIDFSWLKSEGDDASFHKWIDAIYLLFICISVVSDFSSANVASRSKSPRHI